MRVCGGGGNSWNASSTHVWHPGETWQPLTGQIWRPNSVIRPAPTPHFHTPPSFPLHLSPFTPYPACFSVLVRREKVEGSCTYRSSTSSVVCKTLARPIFPGLFHCISITLSPSIILFSIFFLVSFIIPSLPFFSFFLGGYCVWQLLSASTVRVRFHGSHLALAMLHIRVPLDVLPT